jgi:hypothetical protein
MCDHEMIHHQLELLLEYSYQHYHYYLEKIYHLQVHIDIAMLYVSEKGSVE